MKLLNTRSLAKTLDSVNEALFFGRRIPAAEARLVSTWIAGRHDLPQSYAGMFAPTSMDYSNGIRLFTGERISSAAAIGHILGEEACRALVLLDVNETEVSRALAGATRSMNQRLGASESERPGFF